VRERVVHRLLQPHVYVGLDVETELGAKGGAIAAEEDGSLGSFEDVESNFPVACLTIEQIAQQCSVARTVLAVETKPRDHTPLAHMFACPEVLKSYKVVQPIAPNAETMLERSAIGARRVGGWIPGRPRRILITGVACVGKSTLRRHAAEALGARVLCIDRDDSESEPASDPNRVVVVEAVHGLEEPPESWGLVVYLLPPRDHAFRWVRRCLAWLRLGRVFRPPIVTRRPWSLLNLPLILRLLVRNLWNAQSWVREDLDRIATAFQDRTVVTDDVAHALDAIVSFVTTLAETTQPLRRTRNGAMRVFDPGQEPNQWVQYSALLDIWQDEEEPDDLRTFGIRLELPEQPLSDFLNWLPSGRKAEPARDPDRGASGFLALKRRRVWAILQFDRTCCDLANDVAEHRLWSKLQEVTDAKKQRRDILNEVFLECAAALRQPQTTLTEEQGSVLRALWHTELCATAPDESTIGLVNAFPLLVGVDEVFRRIAEHNRARCHNHLRQHDDAVKVLETLADDPYKKKQDSMILRWVGFSALASMADALTHLLRHVEARWYWRKGRVLAEEVQNTFWKHYFVLKLAKSRAEDPGKVSDHGRPRLESLFQEATSKALHDAWLTTPPHLNDKGFVRTVYWRLAWHAAEPRELLSSLKGTMEDLRAITEERGRAFRQPEAALTEDRKQKEILLLQDALLAARECLGECAEKQASWLHPDPASATHQGFTEPVMLMLAWGPLWQAYRTLEEVEKLNCPKPLDANLGEWLETLRKRVRDSWSDFQRVVPAVELEQLIHEPTVTCPAKPKGGKRTLECRDFGCPVHSLRIEEATAAAAGDDPSLRLEEATGAAHRDGPHRPALAGLDYVLTTMARSAAEFDRYLSDRTAEVVSDRSGEREKEGRRTPNIEFISLRRWNSFSPNLGSLAADTVGGGYLLRVWTGKYYLGIAIDPGYNFLENLFNEGLTIADVDLVAVTHAHPDHTDSITNLLTLVRESKKRVLSNPKNTIRFAMSAGVLERYQNFLQAEVEFIPEVVMLSWASAPGNAASQSKLAILASPIRGMEDRLSFELSADPDTLKPLAYIEAIRAHHDDYTKKDSIGFRITIPESNRGGQHQNKLAVGILGDSRYHPELHKGLRDCDVVVLHLGAMLEDSSYRGAAEASCIEDRGQLCHLHRLTPGGCKEEVKKCAQEALYKLLDKNHLYWTGATKLVCDLLQTRETKGRAPLVVLSEFGEELRGGLRADLARRLESHFSDQNREFPGVIPADVGLRIDVAKRTVRCAVCERYWTWKEMDAIAVRPADEGLSFVCWDCQSLRGRELGEILSRRRTQIRPPQKLRDVPAIPESSTDPRSGA
jgi:ribonuclease BN (tRNA processing enzyme)